MLVDVVELRCRGVKRAREEVLSATPVRGLLSLSPGRPGWHSGSRNPPLMAGVVLPGRSEWAMPPSIKRASPPSREAPCWWWGCRRRAPAATTRPSGKLGGAASLMAGRPVRGGRGGTFRTDARRTANALTAVHDLACDSAPRVHSTAQLAARLRRRREQRPSAQAAQLNHPQTALLIDAQCASVVEKPVKLAANLGDQGLNLRHSHGATGLGSSHRPLCAERASSCTAYKLRSITYRSKTQAMPARTCSVPASARSHET